MSRISLASQPFMLGFEQLERLVEHAVKAGSDGYPPFNIEQHDEDSYRIILAVAGFGEADLSVTLEGGQLIVKGRHGNEKDERDYLHRGIAERPFQRSFVLAEHVEVAGARLERGLLHIDLICRKPETVVRRIKIDYSED